MNLEMEDLPTTGSKVLADPLAMIRALAVAWCFAALRSDEIVRLRVGCVRWQYEDVTVPETGIIWMKLFCSDRDGYPFRKGRYHLGSRHSTPRGR